VSAAYYALFHHLVDQSTRFPLMMLQRETSLNRGVAARRAKAARNNRFLESVMRHGIA
jgi:hypothetical protein